PPGIEISPSTSEPDVMTRLRALKAGVDIPTPPPSLLASRQEASRMEFERNLPESTIKSRARETAIGLLEPFDLRNVPALAQSVGGALSDALSGKGTSRAQDI